MTDPSLEASLLEWINAVSPDAAPLLSCADLLQPQNVHRVCKDL